MVLDHLLAAPARGAAGEVGLAVVVGVEQLGDLRILELGEVGDVVLVGGLLVDQIALQRAGRIDTLAVELLVAAGLGVEVRITSYNVCYTKLLRRLVEASPLRLEAVYWDRFEPFPMEWKRYGEHGNLYHVLVRR